MLYAPCALRAHGILATASVNFSDGVMTSMVWRGPKSTCKHTRGGRTPPAGSGGPTPFAVHGEATKPTNESRAPQLWLQRFRNGMFHYQQHYWDDRFMSVWNSDEFANWSLKLFKELRSYFKRWAKTVSPELWTAAQAMVESMDDQS